MIWKVWGVDGISDGELDLIVAWGCDGPFHAGNTLCVGVSHIPDETVHPWLHGRPLSLVASAGELFDDVSQGVQESQLDLLLGVCTFMTYVTDTPLGGIFAGG